MRLFFSGFFLRRINVCLILLESLIRLYIWGDLFFETHQCVFNFIGIIDTSLHWGDG